MSDTPFGIKIETRDWIPENDAVFIYNGVDQVVKHDLTGKEATYTIKKTKMVIVHTGETEALKQLKNRGEAEQGTQS